MSTTRVIALLSQKGGSGKTTITMQLAAGLALRGYRAAVVDLDPQESALRWSESAPPDHPFSTEVLALPPGEQTLAEFLAPVSRRVDFILLDCPPSIEHPHVGEALTNADLALLPMVPSPTDLWATRAMEKLVLHRIAERPGLRGALLPNRVMRTSLAEDVLDVMCDFALPVLDAPLSQRSAYAESAVRGGSVYELGRAAAAAQDEVDRLVSIILQHFED